MKKLILTTSIVAIMATPLVDASEGTTALKQAGLFTTGAIAGAVAGALIGEDVEKADQLDRVTKQAKETEIQLAEKTMLVAELETQLNTVDTQLGELSQLALEKLEFQVLFHTGADQLTERGELRVNALAEFLNKHPQLSVRLIGRADPRGTDEYNNVLSEHRALSVQHALEIAGIEPERIERQAVGALQSVAVNGDYEGYAMERRVDIEVFNPMLRDIFVQAH